jgi:hypothetical protein
MGRSNSLLIRVTPPLIIFLLVTGFLIRPGGGTTAAAPDPQATALLYEALQAERKRAGTACLAELPAAQKKAESAAAALGEALARGASDPPSLPMLGKDQMMSLSPAIIYFTYWYGTSASADQLLQSALRGKLVSDRRLTHLGVSVVKVPLSPRKSAYLGVAVGIELVPALAEEEINRGKCSFSVTCFLCGESFCLQVPAARERALVVRCPKCQRAFDFYAPAEDGSHHSPGWFLRDFHPGGNLKDPLDAWLYVITHCRYRDDQDLFGRPEVWQLAKDTYARKGGDCEDTSILLADWLAAAGFEARVVLGQVRKGGNHAWVVLQKDGQQYILETAGGPKYYRRIPPRADLLPEYFPAIHFNRKELWFRTGSHWTGDYQSRREWARKP